MSPMFLSHYLEEKTNYLGIGMKKKKKRKGKQNIDPQP